MHLFTIWPHLCSESHTSVCPDSPQLHETGFLPSRNMVQVWLLPFVSLNMVSSPSKHPRRISCIPASFFTFNTTHSMLFSTTSTKSHNSAMIDFPFHLIYFLAAKKSLFLRLALKSFFKIVLPAAAHMHPHIFLLSSATYFLFYR